MQCNKIHFVNLKIYKHVIEYIHSHHTISHISRGQIQNVMNAKSTKELVFDTKGSFLLSQLQKSKQGDND